MATHVAEIKWAAKENGEEFLKGRFSRAHTVSFDGGTEVPGVSLAPCRGKMGGSRPPSIRRKC